MKLKKKSENLNFYKTELKKTELLLEINKKIAGLKNLSEILWTIIDFVTEIVDGDRGSLFLNDSETNELYSRVAQGELTREIRILNTVGIAGAIFTSQQGEIIHDVYSDSRFNKEVDQETGYKTRNMVCTPVKTVNGQIIGVIQNLNKKKCPSYSAYIGPKVHIVATWGTITKLNISTPFEGIKYPPIWADF